MDGSERKKEWIQDRNFPRGQKERMLQMLISKPLREHLLWIVYSLTNMKNQMLPQKYLFVNINVFFKMMQQTQMCTFSYSRNGRDHACDGS